MAEKFPVTPFSLYPWSWLYRFHKTSLYDWVYYLYTVFRSTPLIFVFALLFHLERSNSTYYVGTKHAVRMM